MTLLNAPVAMTDRDQAMELYAKYARRLDEGHFDEWASCWAEDGIFESPGVGRHIGRDAILEMVRSFRRDVLAGQQQRHFVANVSVALFEDGRGNGECDFMQIVSGEGSVRTRVVGRYTDTLRRVDGSWRFTSRKVEYDYFEA